MDKKVFVIFHGAYGSPRGNWFPWLKDQLEAQGHTVLIPEFPTPTGQNLNNWLHIFHDLIPDPDENYIFIGHSIGAGFILRLLERLQRPVFATILVAAFVGDVGIVEYDSVNRTFFEGHFDWETIRANAGEIICYGSNDDPAVPQEMEAAVAEHLRCKLTLIRGGKHFNADSGFTSFPRLMQDIDKRLLQAKIHKPAQLQTRQFIERTARHAGNIIMREFGKTLPTSTKQNQSNIVTAVDLQSENYITAQIRRQYPYDSIIAEESGFQEHKSDYCWVVDPIDGTSNFAAGIPWFGVMIAQLYQWEPIAASIYLPAVNELYYAETGRGATRNSKPIKVTSAGHLKDVLVTYGIDFAPDYRKIAQETKVIQQLVRSCRNLRMTNSAWDVALVASGRTGAALNQTAMIWDIAAADLIIREAGGVYTDISGKPQTFAVNKNTYLRNFTYLAASPSLHPQLLALIR